MKDIFQKLSNKKREEKVQEKSMFFQYFPGHQCSLDASKRTNPLDVANGKCKKCWMYLTVVNKDDIRAKYLYRSYATLCAQKRYQFEHFPFSLHPYSKLRFAIQLITVISIVITNITLPIHYSQIDPGHDQTILFSSILTAMDVIYIINMISLFFTGYLEGHTAQYVVLDLKLIAWHYLKGWFLVDLASLPGIYFINLHTSVNLDVFLLSLKLLRIRTLYTYVNQVNATKRTPETLKLTIEIILIVISYLEWNMFFQFATEYWVENSFTPTQPRNCSWIYLAKLWNETMSYRCLYSFDRAVGMLRQNANMSHTDMDTCFDMFLLVAWTIAKLIVLYVSMRYMIALFGCESARAKYFMMAQQVETYMNQRKFPPRIKKKMLKFYALRFQSNFFVESRMISCVSGQLREDIIMHTGRELVSNVEFLKRLPKSLLMPIGMKLKIVIYIAGDIIFKINTIGDCLYFIDKGQVAIYSESGQEVCHLEDGDFFGEIALVMKNRFRTASAIAITNCELFRLDREDFESSIACYPTIYESIKKVASSRFERTNVIDEYHKTEILTQDLA